MLQITFKGFTCNFCQLANDNDGAFYRGKAGDWQWHIENFDTSWGLCADLDQAIAQFKAECASLQIDFGFSDHDLLGFERDRVCDKIHIGTNAYEF